MIALRSPVSGRPLLPDTGHSLADGAGERWPVLDGISYGRAGSVDLAREAVAALDGGDPPAALRLLLPENDAWSDGLPPDKAALDHLIAGQDRLTLREAMELLGYGRVGDYFAHRWSDPTFVAGLALLDAHWPEPATAFELACGIGHYLRELGRVGVRAVGADIVFSKLWLARHWVVGPGPALICMDAEQGWPLSGSVDLAFCHDAFYFLRDKAHVAACLSELVPKGAVLLSHVHNADAANLSGGAAIDRAELEALFPAGRLYADEVLTAAAVRGAPPAAGQGLDRTEAFAVAAGPAVGSPRPAAGPLSRPTIGAELRRNPLLDRGAILWPSDRYAAEYGHRATYRASAVVPERVLMTNAWMEEAARRELVDLPARW